MKRSPILPPVLLLASLVACAGDTPTSCDNCGSTTWRQLAGGLGESRFVAVWANAPDTVLALGSDHPFYRFDGATWAAAEFPAGSYSFLSMWAGSPRDVYAVGMNGLAMHYDGRTWTHLPPGPALDYTDVFKSGTDEVFVTGSDAVNGHVLRYAGGGWTELHDSLASAPRAVWASGSRNVIVGGDGGFVAHYDGRFWIFLIPPSQTTWFDAWGASAASVYFVGLGGLVGHYEPGVLTEIQTPTSRGLFAVYGTSESDIWAVGDDGVIVHFDGASWSVVPSGTATSLRAVWGLGAGGGVIALGLSGTVARYDGSRWQAPYDGRYIAYRDLFGFAQDDVFAVGSVGADTAFVRHLDGREWTLPAPALRSVWGFEPDDVYAVGQQGTAYHYDGASWSPLASGTVANLTGVWGARDGDIIRIYVVGDHGTIRVFDGRSFSPMVPPAGYILDLRDVWAAAPDDAFAVGASGTVLRFKGPPGSLSWVGEETGLAGAGFNAIVGNVTGDVLAVSDNGRIFRYGAGAWREVPVPGGAAPLLDVSLTSQRIGAVVAEPHTLLRLTGGNVSPIDIPFLGRIETAWTTNAVTFVAGLQGSMFEHRE